MLQIVRKTLKELIPTLIAREDGLPGEVLEELVEQIDDYLGAGGVEFRAMYYLALVALVILPLLKKGKTILSLDPLEREEFLNGLYRSPHTPMRGLPTIINAPLQMIYYNREEESRRLGFDARALKEEAEKRMVTRER